MGYVKHEWRSGDTVSSVKLNEMEDGIFNSQEKITESAKLSADLVSEGTTNKLVSADEKTAWNGKSVVSIPTESTATNEAKFINVNGTDYKLATGTGKNWNEIELTMIDLKNMSQGNEIVRPLSELYDATTFRNDYFITNVEQTTFETAQVAYTGLEMKKVYVNVDGFLNIMPYLGNSIVRYIKDKGFDHNYYKTIALYGACTHAQGKTFVGDFDGKNVIYLQDVSQQDWEYDYAHGKEESSKGKREELGNDIVGSAFVISVKGKGDTDNPDCGFLLCMQDSQAAYWDTTNNKLAWANIIGGKAYPVTFDGISASEHGTLRWLLDSVKTMAGSTEMWAVEMEDYLPGSQENPAPKTKKWYLNHGIEFELESGTAAEPVYRVAAAMIVDKDQDIQASCFGLDSYPLSNIFSFNTQFGEAHTEHLKYIGRPFGYELSTFQYKKTVEGEERVITEKDGAHIWTADIDGVTVLLTIPDNYYTDEGATEPTPHRDTYIVSIDTSSMLDTNSIYRHTITVNSTNELDVGEYELNFSLCAVNSESGDTGIDYLLHSDETYGNEYPDWILPVSGTIGRVIGKSPKADVIRPTDTLTRITLNADYPAVEFEKLWESLNKQATVVVGPEEEPTAVEHSYYLFAWETDETTHAIRIYRNLLAEGDKTYFFEIDGNVDYKVTTTGDTRWWRKNGEDWSFMTGENVIFESDEVTGIEQMAVGASHIYVGWDNEMLYQLLSKEVVEEGESAFGIMNQVARVYQAMRISAGWQREIIEEKEVAYRTLFINYIDYAGEWNSVPVITDSNAWKYKCSDFRSEVLAVKTPYTPSVKYELAKAALEADEAMPVLAETAELKK